MNRILDRIILNFLSRKNVGHLDKIARQHIILKV